MALADVEDWLFIHAFCPRPSLCRLHFHRNAAGEYECPVLNKVGVTEVTEKELLMLSKARLEVAAVY